MIIIDEANTIKIVAMTKDLTKGITEIQYNSLNLPRQMDIKSPQGEARNEYLYSASGQKLQVVQRYNSAYNESPVIGSAINTTALDKIKTTDYVGNKIYEGGTLKRILVDGGYYDATSKIYHFYLTDHLGNNRVVAKADGTPIQKTHYYPFGSAFAEGSGDATQPYKYNGKELDKMHGLNMYDYSARHYDTAIGRFTTIDPHAENYYSVSPYAYVGNNPMRLTDPTGMDWVWRIVDGVTEAYYDRDVKSQNDVINKYGKDGGVTHMGNGATLTQYDKDGNIKSQYTFTNDDKNNKYGTVTDMNGDLLNSNEIQYGSNYTIFGTSDNSVNAETLHKNYLGTSYIGPNNPQKYVPDESGADSYQYLPRNMSEYPAIMHDIRYDVKGASGINGALWDKRVLGADIKLTIGSVGVMINPTVPIKDRRRAAGIAVVFGNISMAKFLMAIW